MLHPKLATAVGRSDMVGMSLVGTFAIVIVLMSSNSNSNSSSNYTIVVAVVVAAVVE